jgi:hypothetical protein
MPNHELCRADLSSRERRSQIDGATRHNQSDFRKARKIRRCSAKAGWRCNGRGMTTRVDGRD